MKLGRLGFCAVMAAVLLPLGAQANAIVEQFTISGSASTNGGESAVLSSAVASFNPTDGTLNDIQISLTGPLAWTSDGSAAPDVLVATLGLGTQGENFINTFSPGMISTDTISLNLGGTDSIPASFPQFEGLGTSFVNLFLDQPQNTNDSFATGQPLQGTITYDYTPATTTGVPEPATWTMLLAGLIGVGALMRAARRRANETT